MSCRYCRDPMASSEHFHSGSRISMLAHLERLIEARTVEDIWALHCDRMADYGFDRLLYGFTRFRTAHSFGNIEDTLILSNHHPDYLRAFLDGGIFNHAPMVRW